MQFDGIGFVGPTFGTDLVDALKSLGAVDEARNAFKELIIDKPADELFQREIAALKRGDGNNTEPTR